MPHLAGLLNMVLLHQGDAADAQLIHWLKDQMDEILGLGPWVMVAITSAIIIAIPVSLGLFYFYQQRRGGTTPP